MRTSVAISAAAAVVVVGLGGAAMTAQRAKNSPTPPATQASSSRAKDNQCTSPEHFYNPTAAKRIKERRKAEAIAGGVPKRLADPLYDHLSDCIFCASSTGFDTPQLSWKVDPKKYREKYGEEPQPYYEMIWSPFSEKNLRDGMRDGTVTEFHILFGGTDCKCCNPDGTTSKDPTDGGQSGDEDDWTVASGNTAVSYAWHYRSVKELGTDPPDLEGITPETACHRAITEIHPIRGPRLPEKTVTCKNCAGAADSYNGTVYAINKARAVIDQLASIQGWYEQELECIDREMNLLNDQKQTAKVRAQSETLAKQRSAILKNIQGDKKKLAEKRAEIKGLTAELKDIAARLQNCEATSCSSSSSSSSAPSGSFVFECDPTDGVKKDSCPCAACNDLQYQYDVSIRAIVCTGKYDMQMQSYYLQHVVAPGADRKGLAKERDALHARNMENNAALQAENRRLYDALMDCKVEECHGTVGGPDIRVPSVPFH